MLRTVRKTIRGDREGSVADS